MSNKIAIRLQGLHTGLQLYAVQASPARPPRKHRVLVGTAVDAMKPFIYGLVMSRSSPRGLDPRATNATVTSLYVCRIGLYNDQVRRLRGRPNLDAARGPPGRARSCSADPPSSRL
jgi:hypothetical protein